MPSFRACFTALAVAAFTVVSASQHADAIVARDMHVARAAGSPAVNRRSLAKAAAAKRALARRDARAAASPAPITVLASTPESDGAATIPCVDDFGCRDAVLFPNSKAICLADFCRIRCETGFVPTGTEAEPKNITPPSSCVPDADTCTSKSTGRVISCPIVNNGWTQCNAHGTVCYTKCLKGLYKQSNDDGSFTCVDLRHDTSNCGSIGKVCPEEYNGLPGAIPQCRTTITGHKGCTIACPAGTVLTPTSSTEKPYACL